jgi:hypothetical protein
LPIIFSDPMGINTDARTQSSILIGFEKKADSLLRP